MNVSIKENGDALLSLNYKEYEQLIRLITLLDIHCENVNYYDEAASRVIIAKHWCEGLNLPSNASIKDVY